MEKLELSKPFLVAGKEITELTLNFEALTTSDFKAAQSLKAMISDSTSMDVSKVCSQLRLDSEFQISVGFVAACKGTEGLNRADFLRLPMIDALKLGEATFDNFFMS